MEQKVLDFILEKHKKWFIFKEKDGQRAILQGADLRGADLRGADFTGADLTDADLSYANLMYANFSHTNLCGTNLRDAVLTQADFEFANLAEAILDHDEEIRRGICLKKPIIGYKKGQRSSIITLQIPKGAIVFSINNNKCRTNMAKVIDINNILGESLEEVESCHNDSFIYRRGKMVYPNDFDCRYNVECGSGIHFFRTRTEAEKY